MKLHEQIKHKKAIIEAQKQALKSLQAYILSPKFDKDNQCNVADINLRINESLREIQLIEDLA